MLTLNGFCHSGTGTVIRGSAGHTEQARASERQGKEQKVVARLAATLAVPTPGGAVVQPEPSHSGGSGEHSREEGVARRGSLGAITSTWAPKVFRKEPML